MLVFKTELKKYVSQKSLFFIEILLLVIEILQTEFIQKCILFELPLNLP